MSNSQKRWPRWLAPAFCLLPAAVCLYLMWTADPGAFTFRNDGTGAGHITRNSLEAEVEELRLMVYPTDPNKPRFPGLEPMLRSAEQKLANVRLKQRLYGGAAVVLLLAGDGFLAPREKQKRQIR